MNIDTEDPGKHTAICADRLFTRKVTNICSCTLHDMRMERDEARELAKRANQRAAEDGEKLTALREQIDDLYHASLDSMVKQ